MEVEDRMNVWLMVLEKSNFPNNLPNNLYEDIKRDLSQSFRNDFNLIIEEFDFYGNLSPKL